MLVLERFIGVWPPERCGQPLTDSPLRIGLVAAMQKASPQGMTRELRFLEALDRVRRHAIRGSHLELLDADGVVLTRLEAVALR